MVFAEPLHLLVLIIVGLIFVRLVFFYLWRRRARNDFAGGQARRWRDTNFLLRAGMLTAGLALIVVAAARPQWGVTETVEQLDGADIVIVLDISPGMYAEDVGTSRMRRAQEAGALLAENLVGNRVGLVVVAYSAFPRAPLSSDVNAVAELIRRSENDIRLVDLGTNFAAGLEEAHQMLERAQSDAKAVVFISDGEDLSTGAMEALAALTDDGAVVWTVGVGTAQGATIPLPGSETGETMRHADGSEIVTYLDETMLRAIASAGGGDYTAVSTSPAAVLGVRDQITRMASSVLAEQVTEVRSERFGIFLFAGIVVLTLEWIFQTAGFRLRLPSGRRSPAPAEQQSRA